MANGWSLQIAEPRSNLLHSTARYKSRKRFGFSIADASEPWLWIVRARSHAALRKYKVKKIDLFSVTITNSFLQGTCREQKISNFS